MFTKQSLYHFPFACKKILFITGFVFTKSFHMNIYPFHLWVFIINLFNFDLPHFTSILWYFPFLFVTYFMKIKVQQLEKNRTFDQNFNFNLRRNHQKNFLWASHLWVGRRKEPILGYVPKNDEKKNLVYKRLMNPDLCFSCICLFLLMV